jgi:hypothetical protein
MWTFPIVGEWRHWLGRDWKRAKGYLKLPLDIGHLKLDELLLEPLLEASHG